MTDAKAAGDEVADGRSLERTITGDVPSPHRTDPEGIWTRLTLAP